MLCLHSIQPTATLHYIHSSLGKVVSPQRSARSAQCGAPQTQHTHAHPQSIDSKLLHLYFILFYFTGCNIFPFSLVGLTKSREQIDKQYIRHTTPAAYRLSRCFCLCPGLWPTTSHSHSSCFQPPQLSPKRALWTRLCLLIH